jgi:hypothetical protein
MARMARMRKAKFPIREIRGKKSFLRWLILTNGSTARPTATQKDILDRMNRMNRIQKWKIDNGLRKAISDGFYPVNPVHPVYSFLKMSRVASNEMSFHSEWDAE